MLEMYTTCPPSKNADRCTHLFTVADVDPWLVSQGIVDTAISDGERWMGHDSLWLSPEASSARLAAASLS